MSGAVTTEAVPMRRGTSVASAAAILMVGFVLSRLLGLARVAIQASVLGASGHDAAPASLVRITPKPGVPSQLALPAAAVNDAMNGGNSNTAAIVVVTRNTPARRFVLGTSS